MSDNKVNTVVVDASETNTTEVPGRSVLDLRQHSSISKTVESIKSRVNSITNSAQGVSGRLLSKVKTKEVDTDERILTEAVVALQNILPKSSARSFMSDLLDKIPFAKKVKESVDKTIIDNINAEEAIDKVFKSLSLSLEQMTEDLGDLTELRNILDDTNAECDTLEKEIDAEISAIQADSTRRMDLITLRNLRTEISSIKIINYKTANNLDMQIGASEALSAKMHEIRPLLQGMLSAQLVLASQVGKNQRVQQTTEIVSSLMNEMITEQDRQSHKTLMDTIRLSQNPIIKEKTLVDMAKQNEQQQIEARKLILDIKESTIKYQKTLALTKSSLEGSNIKQIAMNMNELEETTKKK